MIRWPIFYKTCLNEVLGAITFQQFSFRGYVFGRVVQASTSVDITELLGQNLWSFSFSVLLKRLRSTSIFSILEYIFVKTTCFQICHTPFRVPMDQRFTVACRLVCRTHHSTLFVSLSQFIFYLLLLHATATVTCNSTVGASPKKVWTHQEGHMPNPQPCGKEKRGTEKVPETKFLFSLLFCHCSTNFNMGLFSQY